MLHRLASGLSGSWRIGFGRGSLIRSSVLVVVVALLKLGTLLRLILKRSFLVLSSLCS